MPKKTTDGREDRRSRYTKELIENTFLELLRKNPMEKITVTELCKRAEINRGTFYLHFYDTYDVLDVLIDHFLADTSQILDHVLCPAKRICSYPLCQKIQENPQMHPMFLDSTASARLMDRLIELGRDGFVNYLVSNSHMSPDQAEAIFYFQMSGCMEVNRRMLKKHCTEWKQVQQVIDPYIRAGLRVHLKNEDGEGCE